MSEFPNLRCACLPLPLARCFCTSVRLSVGGWRELLRLRDEKKKRIVASIQTVGASGAYYVSSGTNKIYADNGSVVGSIGVIAEWVNYGDLMRWGARGARPISLVTDSYGIFTDSSL